MSFSLRLFGAIPCGDFLAASPWCAGIPPKNSKDGQECPPKWDQLSAERRALPWVKVEKDYVFNGPEGKKRLADLFDGRKQLIVYHFMLGPG